MIGALEEKRLDAIRLHDVLCASLLAPRRLDAHMNAISTLESLLQACPEAVVSGTSVLHDAGWTVYLSDKIDVIVPETWIASIVCEGFELHARSAAWFEQFAPYVVENRLMPMAVLADAWKHEGMWRPHPDELEEDEVDWRATRAIFDEMGVQWPSTYPDVQKAHNRRP